MLASISPLGERARGNRWGLTAGAYTVGSVAAAALLGGALGMVGRVGPEGAALLWAGAVVAAGAGVWDLGRRPVPGVRRQVDENWLSRYRGWVYGFGFGAQLGAGVATIVTTATVYAWMALALLTRSGEGGLAVGASFGLARAAMLGAVGGVDDPAGLRARLRTLTGWSERARIGAGTASLVVAVGCVAAAVAGRR